MTMTAARPYTDAEIAAMQAEDPAAGIPDEPPPPWWRPRRAGEPLAVHAMRNAARHLDEQASRRLDRAITCIRLAAMLRYDAAGALMTGGEIP